MSQGLAGVRRAARAKTGEKFTALLHHVTIDLLRDSFYALKREAAPGVDGVTWKEYEAGKEDRLKDLHSTDFEPGKNAIAPLRSTVKPPFTRPKITPVTRSFA